MFHAQGFETVHAQETSPPEPSSRGIAGFGSESMNNSTRRRARDDAISDPDDSERDPVRDRDTKRRRIECDSTQHFAIGQNMGTRAAVPINARCAASRTVRGNKTSFSKHKPTKAEASISTSDATKE